MIAVTVEFEIIAERVEAFQSAIAAQARHSLARENACRRFDVCRNPEAPSRIFLYEVYDDRKAFDLHLASEHFRQFDAQVEDWVADKRVSIWHIVE